MNFIDENSLNRLNFKELLSRVEILSPYGKEKLNSISVYKIGEERELENEFSQMEEIGRFTEENKNIILSLKSSIHKLKDIKNLLKSCLEGNILDVVDLYEIKRQTLLILEIDKILKEYKNIFGKYLMEDLTELIDILDPNKERVATFYIYETYSIILKEIRKRKREIEKRLFSEKDLDKIKNLKNERLSILVDEEKEEFKIRKNLSKAIEKYIPNFLRNIEKVAFLDLLLGKIKFSETYGGVRPEVLYNKKIFLKKAINVEVKEFLENKRKKYTPINIEIETGTTIITGANMGGKSVALKTIAENVLLFHMGFFPFAKEAKISLMDFLFFVSDDMQDISKGLSTFGAEIIKLKEVNKYLKSGSGLIIFDEFARGTNPKEGQKFVKALAKYLNNKDSISIITTHFDAVVEKEMKHYQVVGLKKINFDELKNKMLVRNDSMELLQEYMDFNLEESNETEVPKDAYNIAKLIGLDEEISEIIYREYSEEE